MEDVLKLKIRFRRSTASDWTTKNPVLLSGEPAVETDTGKFKIGDGIKTWTALPYVGGGGTGDAPALILDHNQSPTAHQDIRDEVASKVDNADARLTDDRTPKPHNHAQSDVTGLSTALTTLTTSVASKVDNADARLTDDRTPKPHNHAQSDVTGLSTALTTLTTSVASKVDNADARLTDSRPPTAHTHQISDVNPVNSSRILGRISSGSGAVEQLTKSQTRDFIGLPTQPLTPGAWLPLNQFSGSSGGALTFGANATQSNLRVIWQWYPTSVSFSVDRIRWFLNSPITGGATAPELVWVVYAPDGENGVPGTMLSPTSPVGVSLLGSSAEKELAVTQTIPAPGVWWALVCRNLDPAGTNPSIWGYPRTPENLLSGPPIGNARRSIMTSQEFTFTNNPAVSFDRVIGSVFDAQGLSVRIV